MHARTKAIVVLSGALVAGFCVLWCTGKARACGIRAGTPQVTTAPPAESAARAPLETRRLLDVPAVAEPWFHGAPVGRRLWFALELTTLTTIGSSTEGARATPQGAHVRGELSLHIADRRADEILFAVCFSDLGVEPLQGQPAAAVVEATAALRQLDGGVLVRAGVDGNALGYRFPPNADLAARNLARSLIAAFSFAVPRDPEARWVIREADAAGEYDSAYSTEAGVAADAATLDVARARDGYAHAAPAFLASRTLVGHARATFARDLGWLRGARVDETASATVAGVDLRIANELHGELQLSRFADGAPAPRACDLVGPWADVRGDLEDGSALAAAEIEADWRRRLAGTTLAQLLSEVRALAVEDPQSVELAQLFERLSWLLRLDAAQPAAIRDAIAGGSVGGAAAEVLIDALGAAGTGAAQSALLALRGDPALPGAMRQRATVAMFQIAAPTPALLGAVFDSVGQATSFGEMEATSLLLLGALSARTDASTVEGLLAFEERARSLGVADVWLESLGNAGTPRALALAQPYLRDADESLRAAAVTAIRKLRSPEARTALASRALGDESVWVRRRAVEELSGFPSREVAEVLGAVLDADADESVRRASLLGLGAAVATDPRARQLVEAAATGDASASLRELARRLLQPSE